MSFKQNFEQEASKKPLSPALMLQGTSSHVGKSILTAAFCRYYYQLGFKVAPFKAQNMSSKLYVTSDGLCISTAQALQAQAAKVVPDVRMNPILLKPEKLKNGESGVEVFWLGKSQGIMPIQEYFAKKEEYFKGVCEVYAELSSENDIIILEGAGSPAEINLRDQDLVNMRMADFAKAKVLLIGDIERGGVFASLVGTLALLLPPERDLVVGLIINKFRGDFSILQPGLELLLQYTEKPCLGVLPYIDVELPEEDSLGSGLVLSPQNLDDLKQLDPALDNLAVLIKKYLNLSEINLI
ncbi:cobyric acid synthase [Desulfovibrio litoralis]|uniref:Cobyric acid synthase n=1 Tax=Desulfovibrio litoralis DSM 11393 TaxID=1121455 RepID=A0A1M7SQN0_9BACT|nr:cobyric acid synthase [Desulfovibrio litoralis]SHN60769.1 cobyric acid synthase CobQ [Desulfovibrio litoralis DSM 11393]